MLTPPKYRLLAPSGSAVNRRTKDTAAKRALSSLRQRANRGERFPPNARRPAATASSSVGRHASAGPATPAPLSGFVRWGRVARIPLRTAGLLRNANLTLSERLTNC